ncbi:tetratricopeptide repeat protein [Polyangium mundeleinium]|uniref:Tetratricopeptide repeat protein n=1 Tax=Polyangium mundeleinium TaxID=2995306 RepID=A0ABT5EQS2_9BACT|nr:hypothetical protein [Polyangium mundeleinium]MDC0743110.1 hypothetical protein [Polyangium mundeleinium]
MRMGCLSVVGLLGLLGFAAPARADDAPEPGELDPETIQAAADEARFAEYVLRGDRARASGQIADAVLAYSEALKVRPDPLIAGRLGVLLVKAGRPAKGADLLHDAVNRDWRASPAEREQFKAAYDAARAVVCMLDVTISHIPERTTLDGESINPKHRTGFFIFAMPGEHEIRASLTGYRDGRAIFTACRAGSMDVAVVLTPLPLDPSIEPTPRAKPSPEPSAIPAPPGLPEVRMEPLGDPRLGIAGAVAVVDGKPLPKQEDPYGYDDPPGSDGKKSGVRGSIGAGPIMVLGVASWAPAVGMAISAGVRPSPFLSVELDARTAWLTSGIKDGSIQAMTAGGILSMCGRWRWAFGCAVGHAGIMKIDFARDPYEGTSKVLFRPGIGGRAGAEIPLASAFAVRLAADVLALSSRTRIVVNQIVVADQPAVMTAVTAMGLWNF